MNRVKWTALRLAAAAAAALPATRACAYTQVVDGNIVAVDSAKVAAMFEATSDLRDWDGAAKLTPEVEVLGTDANVKMTFAVTPGDGTAQSAFMRIHR